MSTANDHDPGDEDVPTCHGVIPNTFIACGEDGNYCSPTCLDQAMRDVDLASPQALEILAQDEAAMAEFRVRYAQALAAWEAMRAQLDPDGY